MVGRMVVGTTVVGIMVVGIILLGEYHQGLFKMIAEVIYKMIQEIT